ncbi:LOLA3 protein, partial [Acromyrmex insinuator]
MTVSAPSILGIEHKQKIRRRSKVKPKYPCTNCSSTFKHKRSLLKHLKYECGQSPRFKCPYCELISKKSSNILRHIRLKHKGYEVYVQDICYLRPDID